MEKLTFEHFELACGNCTGITPWDKFKPILRPLSDLTKEIEINGKIFIPMKILFDIPECDENAFDLFKSIC